MKNKLKVFCSEYISITLIIIFIGIFSAIAMNVILYKGVPILKTNISRDGWASFSGAFIGGALTLIGVNITIKNEARRRRNEEKPIIVLSKKIEDNFFNFSISAVTQIMNSEKTKDIHKFRFYMNDFEIENIGKNPIYKFHISLIFSNGEKHEIIENGLIKSNEKRTKSTNLTFEENNIVLNYLIFKVYDLYNNCYITELSCKCELNDHSLRVKEINYIKVAEII